MFVVKDPDLFATQIIPQYFDHNKFSSFARQLNFYGFRKMQSKPIRNSDFDAGTAKHVTFYNENFKRGRCDLLKKIQRSTRGGNPSGGDGQQKEVQNLRDQVAALEQKVSDMNTTMEERLRRLELDMLGRMEQLMVSVQQQQNSNLHLQKTASIGSAVQSVHQMQGWGEQPNNLTFPRGTSINSMGVASAPGRAPSNGNAMSNIQPVGSLIRFPQQQLQQQQQQQQMSQQQQQQQQQQPLKAAAPTLPPHPKQKQLPLNGFPGSMSAPPDRMSSLRGISQLSMGLSRGASIESSASAVLMRNSWEDKFFSMLMMDANEQQQQLQQQQQGMTAPTSIVAAPQGSQAVVSNTPSANTNSSNTNANTTSNGDNDLSSVSSTEMN